jgi:hypothetical protein
LGFSIINHPFRVTPFMEPPKWSYHSVVEPKLIMKLCGKPNAINLYKPTIWGWLKSKPFMMILGMVYNIGFTTCSYEIVYNWDSTSLN